MFDFRVFVLLGFYLLVHVGVMYFLVLGLGLRFSELETAQTDERGQ